MSISIIQGSGNTRKALEGQQALRELSLFRGKCPHNPYKLAHVQRNFISPHISRVKSVCNKAGYARLVRARPVKQEVVKHYMHGAVAVSSGDVYG